MFLGAGSQLAERVVRIGDALARLARVQPVVVRVVRVSVVVSARAGRVVAGLPVLGVVRERRVQRVVMESFAARFVRREPVVVGVIRRLHSLRFTCFSEHSDSKFRSGTDSAPVVDLGEVRSFQLHQQWQRGTNTQ